MKGEFYKMEYEAWDEGTDQLTLEQEGAYLRFCHQMYRRRGPVIDDERVLARLWKCHPNKVKKLRSDLIEAGKIFATGDGHLTNTRVTQEIDRRETTRTQRVHAGRTGGIRSGETRRKPLENNDPHEAFASSETNQRREEKSREDIPPFPLEGGKADRPQKCEAELIALGVHRQTLNDWQAVRRSKRAGPITRTVVDGLVAEAGKARISVADAVRIAAERGWQGFRAEWVANLKPNATADPATGKVWAQTA